MMGIGSFSTGDCQGLSRRAFLQIGAGLPFATGLAEMAQAAKAPKAKSVLVVWLFGGPSHLDLFDPKPEAPAEYRGPFASIPTRTPGVRFTELLPRLAARSDRFSLIRTNINYNGGHRPAGSACGAGATSSESTAHTAF